MVGLIDGFRWTLLGDSANNRRPVQPDHGSVREVRHGLQWGAPTRARLRCAATPLNYFHRTKEKDKYENRINKSLLANICCRAAGRASFMTGRIPIRSALSMKARLRVSDPFKAA